MPQIITITTDFGLNDSFVGVMKGVIYSINPGVTIVDVNHNIERHSITQCAITIKDTFKYFPENTIHLVVVDPGVGTERRPLIVESWGHYFVGPDNGIFSLIYDEKSSVYEITNSDYFLSEISSSFHGRDIFSPVAANLAILKNPIKFGKTIDDYVRIDIVGPTKSKNTIKGEIIYIDGFGNMMTNIENDDVDYIDEILVNDKSIGRLSRSYSDARENDLVAIYGSSGKLEIAVNRGNASARYKNKPAVTIVKKNN